MKRNLIEGIDGIDILCQGDDFTRRSPGGPVLWLEVVPEELVHIMMVAMAGGLFTDVYDDECALQSLKLLALEMPTED